LQQRPRGQSGLIELFNTYKNTCAKKRNVPFDLTIDEFRLITSNPCHYCGVLPYKLVRSICPSFNKHMNDWGNYIYNGIDQKIAGGGYVIDNVLPCCEICNWAKSDRTYEKFIAYLDRLARFRAK